MYGQVKFESNGNNEFMTIDLPDTWEYQEDTEIPKTASYIKGDMVVVVAGYCIPQAESKAAKLLDEMMAVSAEATRQDEQSNGWYIYNKEDDGNAERDWGSPLAIGGTVLPTLIFLILMNISHYCIFSMI